MANDQNASSNHRPGLIIALSAACLFSTKPVLIKYLYTLGVEPLPLLWLRMMLALPVYLVIGYLAWRKLSHALSIQQVLSAVGVGLLGYYLASYLDLAGLQYVSAQLERLILYAYPSFVVILGAIWMRKAISVNTALAIILTYCGLLLMYGHDLQTTGASSQSDIQWGSLLLLGSALSFALYILLSKPVMKPMGSLLFTALAMGSASLAISLHHGLVNDFSIPDMSIKAWAGIFVLSLFATVLPSFMVSEAIKQIGPEKTSMSGTLGPVITTALAVLFLDEPFSLFSLVGMGLVLVGIYRLSR